MRRAIVESDTIGLRCGCRTPVGTKLQVSWEPLRRPDRKFDLAKIVTHARCGASWIWGEVCAAPRRKSHA